MPLNSVVILNRGSGVPSEDFEREIAEVLTRHGIDTAVKAVAPDALDEACREAIEDGAAMLIAAGGDGTVRTAASWAARHDVPLGVLPAGTLNHFARDAGIPADLDEAAAAIAAGHERRVDLAEVNGVTFVNTSSLGLYPDMVRFRDETQARTGRGKRRAMLSASLRALRSFRRRRLWLSAEGIEARLRTPLLFVGNNRYQVNLFALGRREALDEGLLCVYAVRARSRLHFIWAALRGVFGRLDQQRDFVTAYVREAEIDSNRPAQMVSIDGETMILETPLNYRVRPGALRLIVPEPEEEPATDAQPRA
ncbi:MAG: diacylglycerol/lipid kinase family protein [Sphingosinicella sp.]